MPDPVPSPSPDACERQLLAFAEALPIGVVLLDGARIHAVNAAAADQFGFDAHTAAGLAVEALFDGDVDPRSLAGQPGPVRCTLRRRDGSVFHAELRTCALAFGARTLTLASVCDLSESERIRDQLARQHDELHAMTRRLLGVQEEERRTLSRELHDDIGQQITAIKLGAMALQDDADPVRRAEILAEIIDITDQTVAKVRNLSLLLRPPQLDALGLEAALRWQAETMFRGGCPRLELRIAPLPTRPSPAVELACFRIAQESLTNVLRHAKARQVRLVLETRDGRLVLEVVDDGRGFGDDAPAGLGLATMRERVEPIGGQLRIDSAPGRGTHVHMAVPIRPD